MNKKYRPSLTPKKEKKEKDLIRSPAFRKKFDDGMPRINHKAIPFHNVYDVEISNRKVAEEKGYKFWGCIVKDKKEKPLNQSREVPRRFSKSRG